MSDHCTECGRALDEEAKQGASVSFDDGETLYVCAACCEFHDEENYRDDQIYQEEIKRMGLRQPIADDPLTFREQDELFGWLGVLRDRGRRDLLDCEMENILRMAATLKHYRAWLCPEIDQTLPKRVTLRGVCYLRTEL